MVEKTLLLYRLYDAVCSKKSICLSSAVLNPRRGAALSGISPQCFSRGSSGPRSWRTPTRFCLGSAGPTTLWWRSHCSYSSSLESFCKWWRDHNRCLHELSSFHKDTHICFCVFGIVVVILLVQVSAFLKRFWATIPEYCLCSLSLNWSLMLSIFFRMVIYFHTQVVDGQRRIISRLEKQIENVRMIKHFSKRRQSLYIPASVRRSHSWGITIISVPNFKASNPSNSCDIYTV